MTGFRIGAGILAIALLALLFRPRRGWLALVVGSVAVALALLLYHLIGNWQAQPQSAAEQQARAEIAALQVVARDHPSDASAWLTLGQKYLQFEQYRLAENALGTANRLDHGGNAATLAALAEAMALDGDESNDAQVAPLFDNVLRLEPRNAKALFYTGLKALQEGQLPLARTRFSSMLGPEVPAEVQAALKKQIAAIDLELAAAKGRGSAGKGLTEAANSGSNTDSNAATLVNIELKIAPGLQSAFDARARAGAPLFVFVRNPKGGPPLAVKRLAAALPVRVVLSASDAMIASNRIQAHQQVLVAARLSVSGAPTGGPGDVFGEVAGVAGNGKPLVLLLDRIAP